jgi:hypothetical protein
MVISGQELQADPEALGLLPDPSHIGENGNAGSIFREGNMKLQDFPLTQRAIRQQAQTLFTDVAADAMGYPPVVRFQISSGTLEPHHLMHALTRVDSLVFGSIHGN